MSLNKLLLGISLNYWPVSWTTSYRFAIRYQTHLMARCVVRYYKHTYTWWPPLVGLDPMTYLDWPWPAGWDSRQWGPGSERGCSLPPPAPQTVASRPPSSPPPGVRPRTSSFAGWCSPGWFSECRRHARTSPSPWRRRRHGNGLQSCVRDAWGRWWWKVRCSCTR